MDNQPRETLWGRLLCRLAIHDWQYGNRDGDVRQYQLPKQRCCLRCSRREVAERWPVAIGTDVVWVCAEESRNDQRLTG